MRNYRNLTGNIVLFILLLFRQISVAEDSEESLKKVLQEHGIDVSNSVSI